MIACRQVPMWLIFGLSFLTRKEECLGFVADLKVQRHSFQRIHHHVQQVPHSLARRRPGATVAVAAASMLDSALGAIVRATATQTPVTFGTQIRSARTALHATGFGASPAPRRPAQSASTRTPDPRVYYPNDADDDSDDNDADGIGKTNPEKMKAGKSKTPFPELGGAKKVREPRGIGTLFESENEVIRELSSDEYLDVLKDWAPIASFAAVEAVDDKVKAEASCILTVLRGMAEWQPKRNADYTKLGSKWAFGAPIGAIKDGQVDALACLQVSEDEGVVVEWICGNPVTLGIPGNAVEWLAKGVHVLCGKRLDLPVTISARARGEEGGGDGEGSSGRGYGGGAGGGGKGKKKSGGRNSGTSGKKKGGSKKRR